MSEFRAKCCLSERSSVFTLHDEKVWVVDIKLHRMKQILNLTGWCIASIDEIFALAADQNLTSDGDFFALFVSNRGRGLLFIIENDAYRCLIDPRLTLFVNQFRKVSGANLTQVGDAKNEANRVEDVGFSRTIQSSDGIEMRIESRNDKHMSQTRMACEAFQTLDSTYPSTTVL